MAYSHDSFGLGHLRRNLLLVAALGELADQAQFACVTGSPTPELFALPPRSELLQLPTIGKSDTGGYRARHLPLTLEEITTLRSDALLATWRTFCPHLLLVDHTPTGPGRELEPLLKRIRAEAPQTRIVLGLRDILDSPARGRAELLQSGAYDLIRDCYDHVLVYGQQSVFDHAREYEMPDDIAQRVRYTGYVVPAHTTAARPAQSAASRPHLVATAGGGEDGIALLRALSRTLAGPLRDRELKATIVCGPLMAEVAYGDLAAASSNDPRIEVLRATDGLGDLLQQADLTIAMGGYNTVYEALARGCRLLTLPRCGPRQEQLERCQRLADLGALYLLDEERAADPALFAAAIERALADDGASTVRLEFNGAQRAAEACLEALTGPHSLPNTAK
jgi:predicted glycosyltransferase